MTRTDDAIPVARSSPLSSMAGLIVLFLPMAVLFTVTSHYNQSPLLAGGIATEAFLALGLLRQAGAARSLSHKNCNPVYLIAVLVLWMSAQDRRDFYLHVGMVTLVGVPLLLFVWQEFLFTGNGGLRRARALVRRLAARTEWPSDLALCKALPEVKALREALREDADPVMILLMNPRVEVRVAALAALEYRPSWRSGQAEAVLQAAKFATEPPVRAAAIMALANVDDSNLASSVAVYLRDFALEVRAAACEALLWDANRRWPHIRREVRLALADPRCLDDGPLPFTAALPQQTLIDLTQWAGEKGAIGVRSTLTLLEHYRRELTQNPSSDVVDELVDRILDNLAPSALRVEYANLIAEIDCIDPRLWAILLEESQPTYLRLLAAGATLRNGPDEAALCTLKDVARVPNREMAMQVAAIIQRFLQVDMGLPLNGPPPEPQSKGAAEVARRVLDWSQGRSMPLHEERSSRRTRTSVFARVSGRSSGENPRRRI